LNPGARHESLTQSAKTPKLTRKKHFLPSGQSVPGNEEPGSIKN